jgi:DNA polymerase-1
VFGPVIGMDTEGSIEAPWCLSTSNDEGVGHVWRRPETIALFARYVAEKAARGFSQRYILHSSLHDLPVLRALGIHLPDGSYIDTMVMAYLLREDSQGLKELARLHCGMEMDEYVQLVGHWVEKGKRKKKQVWSIEGRSLDDIDPMIALRYAARDADATRRTYFALKPRIEELGLATLLDIEMGVVPILDRMQTVGMLVDRDHFPALSRDLAAHLAVQQAKLDAIAGRPINPGSSKQTAALLFEDLRIPSRKKTKKGAKSSQDKVLQALHHQWLAKAPGSPQERALALVMDWREAKKMKTSFADKILGHVGADNRFHPTLLNTRVETGRLAGKGINPLAFPKHSDWGKRFRKGFIAPPGCLIGSWDLNQIELRVLADISGDTTMREAFRNGEDLHAKLVYSLYGIPPEKQTGKDRREGKTINFAIPMGVTPFGLLEQFHKNGLMSKTIDDAEQVLHDTLHKVYPGVAAFQDEARAEARRTGMVRDMWGRIYYLPDINSDMASRVAAAERQAAALQIQGGAQGIMKLGMAEIWRIIKTLRAEGAYVEPLLQVHDDNLLEYEAGLDELLDTLVSSAMTGATSLSVPITVKHESGTNWGELD